MLAHPAVFQKVLLEKDPLFSDPDADEVTFGFEYADKVRALRMLHPELILEYEKYARGYKRAKAYQQKKYGVVGWYDWNCKYYGCKWDMDFENWELQCERGESVVLSAQMETPWSEPMAFIEYINKIDDGIKVYAYGYEGCSFFYSYQGSTGEYLSKDPDEDDRYEEFKKAFENSEDYDPDTVGFAVPDMIIADYIKTFKTELEKEFLTD
jgi:hypothetical protein